MSIHGIGTQSSRHVFHRCPDPPPFEPNDIFSTMDIWEPEVPVLSAAELDTLIVSRSGEPERNALLKKIGMLSEHHDVVQFDIHEGVIVKGRRRVLQMMMMMAMKKKKKKGYLHKPKKHLWKEVQFAAILEEDEYQY